MKNNNRTFAATLAVACLSVAALTLLMCKTYSVIIAWVNLVHVGIFIALTAICIGALGFFASKLGLKKSAGASAVRGVVCMAVSLAVLFGLLTVNAQVFSGRQNRLFVGTAFGLISAMLLCLYLILCAGQLSVKSKAKKAVSLVTAAALIIASPVVSVLAITAVAFRDGVSVIGCTEGEPIIATRRDYCFDNSSLIIGGYCSSDGDNNPQLVKWAKEAGIDFLISDNKDEAFLTACDENNVGVILGEVNTAEKRAALPRVYFTADEQDYQAWYNITKDGYYSDEAHTHECIWGNHFYDEPSALEFESIARGVKAYNDVLPDKLAYVNHFPFASPQQLAVASGLSFIRTLPVIDRIDRANDYISRYKTFISKFINSNDTDYLSFDIYPLAVDKNKNDEYILRTGDYWLRNLDILAEACRKTNRDLWVITQSSGEVDETGEVDEIGPRFTDTPEEIRWQYYVSLSFGAKALINALYYHGWWDTASHMIDENKQRTDTYYAVQTAVNEVSAFSDIYGDYKNLGAFLVNGKMAAGNKTNTLCPVEDEAKKPDVTTQDPILVGCFNSENGGRAYTLVNMWEPQTEKSAALTAVFEGAEKITVYRKGVESIIEGDTLELSLESYEGVFVTVEG